MFFSIALILLSGLISGWICKKIKLPSLFGMILAGIVMGPFCLNLIDNSILNISSELRKIALVIILLRAGLKLNIQDLKKVGRPAFLMCFLPAVFEITAMIIFAPMLLNISYLDAAIMGSVVAAVSPAVIVPKMIKLMDEGYGTEKSIPQMILAGASVDDVFVIVMFTTFTSLAQGSSISFLKMASVPVSIITGIAAGMILGIAFYFLWTKLHMRDTAKVIIIFSTALLFIVLEDKISNIIPFASLIAVMFLGVAVKMKNSTVAIRLSGKLDRMWVPAEIFLFVLVGASVSITNAMDAGLKVLLLLLIVSIVRMAGVFVCMIKTNLTFKERLFCMVSYIPKATVQAAIGGLPLAMGLECGNIVLTVSVIAILITAPVGAFLIDLTYTRCLKKYTA